MADSPWPAQVGELLLRDAVESDLDPMLALRNDPEVNRWMLRTHVDPDTFRAEWLGAPDSDTDHSCVAEFEGRPIGLGFLEITPYEGQPGTPRRSEGSIGYVVDPGVAGRGFATSIASGLLAAAFERLGLRRVVAGCFADNLASVRVLEKAGMRREQHGIEDSWHSELGWIDGYTYAMLAQEWPASAA